MGRYSKQTKMQVRLMIPNRKFPAVGKASYGRDFLDNKRLTQIQYVLVKEYGKRTTFLHLYW